MPTISFIPKPEFDRILKSPFDPWDRMELFSEMCRLNALSAVKRAGSGHLGSSFSSMDLFAYLYLHEMNVLKVGADSPDRDVFFSSKGHDAPGLYAVLTAIGLIPFEQLYRLRRLGGLDGHPDVHIPGVEANTGSLGMGISKGKGVALAKKMGGRGGRVFVLTGDGELHEGQIWESMQTAAHHRVGTMTAIIDSNKIQTDRLIDDIVALGDLQKKFTAFGWHVERCDGHNLREIDEVFKRFRTITDRPKILIADTVKGKGVSFMEGPQAMRDGKGLYLWHAGAPDDVSFEKGHAELLNRINARLEGLKLSRLSLHTPPVESTGAKAAVSDEKLVKVYGEALVEIAARRKDIVVLDGDLSADCGIRLFEKTYPDRFIENGIAEQDMVSTAGGLARHGFLPVVNTFASFLAARANEQIYNNATEGSKIIYVCHYAGLIPAGPGKSHQSIRDISLFGALPGFTIIEPCNTVETKQALEWCVNEAKHSCVLRLPIGPSPRRISLPADYRLTPGRGAVLCDGRDAVIFSYGPVMLNEALLASELLAEKKFSLKVVSMPWLNRCDASWLAEVVGSCRAMFVLEDHAPVGGLGDTLWNAVGQTPALREKPLTKLAVEGFPACGTPQEALRAHGLDGESLAKRIIAATIVG